MVREMEIDIEINGFYELLGEPFINHEIGQFKERTLGIVLLTPEKMQHMPWVIKYKLANYVDRYVFIGKCFPNLIPRPFPCSPPHVWILLLDVLEWINADYNSVKATEKEVSLNLIQRTKRNAWMALPVIKIKTDKIFEIQIYPREKLYGLLRNFTLIFQFFGKLRYVDLKDGQLTGVIGTIFQFLKEYLQFKTYVLVLSERYSGVFTDWSIDTPCFLLDPKPIDDTGFLPELYKDGITLVAKNLVRYLTINQLLSSYKPQVWMIFLAMLLLFNVCFLFAFDGSPSLIYHPKVKNKGFTRFIRILFFDSLIRLHTEWQQGPTVPIRVILVALNFYIFIMLNFFLALFTVQVLKINYFPFKKLSDICQHDGNLIVDYESSEIFKELDYISDDCKNVIHSVSLSTFAFTAVAKIDCLYNGSCVLMTLSHVASRIIQHKPDISKLKHTVGEVRMSIMNEDYGVGNILARLILRLREVGILSLVRKRYALANEDIPPVQPVDFTNTALTFSILGVGMLLSFSILAMEILIHKLKLFFVNNV